MKKLWFYLLMPLLVFFGLASVADTVEAKELNNAITDVKVWSTAAGDIKQPNADGSYTYYKDTTYRFMVDFDLSDYNDNLEDGDTFTFTIPEPFTVTAETFDLNDKSTGIAVGEANVVSSGPNKGGKVTITMKNLQEYLNQTGGTGIRDVAGTFFVTFISRELANTQTYTFPSSETKTPISHTFKIQPGDAPNYGTEIGISNFSKAGGILERKPWTSALLGKSGDYRHNWQVRLNQKQAAYDTITIHDWVSENYAPMQFIPETFKVIAGWYDADYSLKDQEVLAEGTDYTVVWNESYTDFVVTINNAKDRIKNGKPAAYRIEYATSAPADGTRVGNKVEMQGDGQVLTNQDGSTKTEVEHTANSTVSSGGSIQLKTGYRITFYKVDRKNQNRLAGAKFKITPPEGATAQEVVVETNSDGVGQSPIYSEDDVKLGEFTIVETEAPEGYKLDPTPVTVTVGKDGVIRTFYNDRYTTTAQLEVNKELTGRTLNADEFEFDLTDSEGNVLETVKNTADGSVKFSELTFDEPGTFTYTITEKTGDLPGVEYDAKTITATVTVTREADGKLSSSVAYDDQTARFVNKYTPTPTTVDLEVTKALTGKELTDGEFTFTLFDEEGAVVATANNTAEGKVVFSNLPFTEAGVYNYTIKEANGGQTIDNLTYDDLVVEVTVTVEDDGQGNLVASVAYSDDTEFNNVYEEPTTTTTTEEPTTTEGPATTTEEPTTTEGPATTTEEPTTTEGPATTTEEPTTTEGPSTTSEEPTTTEVPSTTTEEPTTTEVPSTTTEEPTTTEGSSTTSEEPTTTEVPSTTSEEPTTTEVPSTTTEEPTTTEVPSTTTEEPTTTEGPATTSDVPVPTTTQGPKGGKKGGLPRTGEDSGMMATLIGLALAGLAVGAEVLYRKSKKG